MPEPGMGSGGARGGAGMGGGGRQDRDEPGPENLLSGESVGSVLGSDPRSGGKVGGHYSYERGRWVGGTSPKKASPEESFSAIPAVTPVAKPVSRIEMYLDETPALQTQIDSSAAAAAAERQRTMGATMGGGPSYDPLTTGEEAFPANDYNTEAEASSWPLQLTNYMRSTRIDPLTGKTILGYKNPVWKPEFSKWGAAKKADWMAGFDKTLGAAGRYSKNKQEWEEKATEEEKQVIWNKVTELMEKNLSEENLSKLMNSGYNMSQLTSILNPENTGTIRDIIRHGIATNKYGLMKMTAYETFKSGQELSDYTNNLAAYRFARTLRPDQDFDDEWASAVIQEKMNPGSTGLNLSWSASTENDLTAGGWWANLWADYKQGGLLGGPAANPAAGGMITQVEQGGG